MDIQIKYGPISNPDALKGSTIITNMKDHKNGIAVSHDVSVSYTKYKRIHESQESRNAVGIITGGLSDTYLANQAEFYLTASGHSCRVYSDLGIDKDDIFYKFSEFNKHKVLIVIAGMEAAVSSIVADNTEVPVLFVPSKCSYGYGSNGEAGLLSAIRSNSVMAIFNIENIWSACKCAMLISSMVAGQKGYLYLEESPMTTRTKYEQSIIVVNVLTNGHYSNFVACNNRNALVISTCPKDVSTDIIKSLLNNCVLNTCLVFDYMSFLNRINKAPMVPDVSMVTNEQFFNGITTRPLEEIIKENKDTVVSFIKTNVATSFSRHELSMKCIDLALEYLLFHLINCDPCDRPIAYIKIMNILNYRFNKNYKQGLLAIANALELFDIIERRPRMGAGPGTYYHTLNYSYYMYKVIEDPNEGLVPLLFDVSATSIIKARPMRVYFIGISVNSKYVDEYIQSPLEFFYHDINHSRRMIANNQRPAGLDDFSKVIIDLITIRPSEPDDIKATRQLIKMLIFEIVHEDALDLDPTAIWSAIHRDSDYIYTFEKMMPDYTVVPTDIKVSGALAYTRYKLQYQFYDTGSNDLIVIPAYRKASYIAVAAMIIASKIRPYLEELKELNDFTWYLDKASDSKNVPSPVHEFRVLGLDYDDSLTIDNNWSNGYRRIVGEHMGLSNVPSIQVPDIRLIPRLTFDDLSDIFDYF